MVKYENMFLESIYTTFPISDILTKYSWKIFWGTQNMFRDFWVLLDIHNKIAVQTEKKKNVENKLIIMLIFLAP